MRDSVGAATILRRLRAEQAAVRREQRRGAPLRRVRGDGAWPEYRRLLEDSRYADLLLLADAERAARLRDRRAIGWQAELVGRAAENAVTVDRLERKTGGLAGGLPGRVADLPIDVRAALAERGVSSRRAGALLRDLTEAGGARPRNRTTVRGFVERLDQVEATNLRALMGAHLAGAVARFNLAVVGQHQPAPPEGGLPQIADALEQTERALHAELRRGLPLTIWAAGADLYNRAVRALDAGVGLAYEAVTEDGDTVPERQLLPADLLRAALRAIAVAARLRIATAVPQQGGPLEDWIEAAGAPFASKARVPPERSVSSLMADPARRDGELVSLVGRIIDLRIEHVGSARKVISTAALQNGAGGEASLVLPHLKLDSGGAIRGATVRASGVWRHRSDELGGRPGLELDRVPYGELGEASFSDWATNRVRDAYVPSPHGVALSWGWLPGVDGAGNQLRYRTWFARR